MELTEKRGLSGAGLKWIALCSMLIDHTGMVLVWQGWIGAQGRSGAAMALYAVLRGVGRLAFPIFCFLLTEGFVHTHSRGKYLLRLLAFALMSELPFDLAGSGVPSDLWSQNVFFTLALGLLAVWAWQAAGEGGVSPGRAVLGAASAGACMAVAQLLKTDYGALGVLLILAFYLLRGRPWLRDLAALLALGAMVVFDGSWWIELFGAFSLPLLHLYNGERGRQSKWFFYVFYPAHLLLLYLLKQLIWGG